MYSANDVINRINSTVKQKGFTQKQMCADLQMSVDTINRMTDKKGIGSFTLARIADYLDVSTDYLLGREKAIAASAPMSSQADKLLKILSSLNVNQQSALLVVAQTMLDSQSDEAGFSRAVLV